MEGGVLRPALNWAAIVLLFVWYPIGVLGSAISRHDEAHFENERIHLLFIATMPDVFNDEGYKRSFNPKIERLNYGWRSASYYGWAILGPLNFLATLKDHYSLSLFHNDIDGKVYELSVIDHWGLITESPLAFYSTHSH